LHSFECYINTGKEITDIDHVVEVNHNIANADDSINMNLRALNEEMGYDAHIKEKLDIKKLKRSIPEEKLKNFIELPNNDEDIVLKKEFVDLINNKPLQEEEDIETIDEEKEMNELKLGQVIRAAVDVSSMGVTENEDVEAESEEDDVILVGDGEPKEMRKYATEICIPHSHESGMITGGIKRDVIIPAGSESSDDESG
jgi:hypothetical protein